MKYEIDFIGAESKRDADAIGIHWIDGSKEVICVYDGGFNENGEKLGNIIQDYYFNNNKNDIDFVICSHSDKDHVSGLKYILENFEVKELYVNLPWKYIDELFEMTNDERITKKSLEKRLKQSYSDIAELEEIANEKNVKIKSAFAGTKIGDKIEVLSPMKKMYLSLIAESSKNDFIEKAETRTALYESTGRITIETWEKDLLKDDVSTSAENETSVVLIGDLDNMKFLLTGDAGVQALKAADKYCRILGRSLKDEVDMYQIPHHGSRHNVNSPILDSIVGEIKERDSYTSKKACVCVGKDSKKPNKMVTNAFVRRGVNVYVAANSIITCSYNMGERYGWDDAENIDFCEIVEDW